MIGRYPTDELDVLSWNRRSARLALGFPPPELPKLPLPPLDHRLWPNEDQLRGPVSPDLGEQRPEQAVTVSQPWFLRLSLVHAELLSEQQNSDQGHPVEPREDNQVESLYGREYK